MTERLQDDLLEELQGINGTMVWYYYICPREVWLISRQLEPDPQHEYLEWGRYLHEHAYSREKKEIAWDSIKIDILNHASAKRNELIVAEVKKSSAHLKSAKMQIAFYLYRLKLDGIDAMGELRFPEERRREPVILDSGLEKEIRNTVKQIRRILAMDKPPEAKRVRYCGKCAYSEFCWA